MRNKINIMLGTSYFHYIEAQNRLDKALDLWLSQFNFPDYIKEKFHISFVSNGTENVVHFGDEHNPLGVEDISLKKLINFKKEDVINYFNLKNL